MHLSKRKSTFVLVMLAVLILAGSLFLSRARARAEWQQKVDPWVLETSAIQPDVEFIIVLAEQADLSGADLLSEKLDKGTYVYEQLTAVARRSQPPVLDTLQIAGLTYRPFWVTNAIWVKGDAADVEALARRPDVAKIQANPRVKLDVIGPLNVQDSLDDVAMVEWNIDLVRAPEVWDAGVNGQGIVIGGQDTGYDWQHPALINQYRGWNGTAADHNYNWHDAIHDNNSHTPPGNTCGFDSPQPCDDHGHGTHTMGTMVGDDGSNNQIGMAPGAQWIACRNMEQGWGTPATYTECYEWFIAPYPAGADPMVDGDPAKAPDVINNSWSCPIDEGCTDPDILRDVVGNVRAAGIVTVHSAGNDGPSCSTVHEPAAIYDASFTVAATDFFDAIAGFSSRGPVTKGDNNPAKPDISAPGVGVRSSYPGGSYTTMSGTSMAAPHVAGLVGLLMAAQPDLRGNVDAVEKAMMDSALSLYTNQGCGGDEADSLPNHVFGWGRIDAKKTFDSLNDTPVTPTPTSTLTPPTPTSTSAPPTATGTIASPTATGTPPNNPFYLPILMDRQNR